MNPPQFETARNFLDEQMKQVNLSFNETSTQRFEATALWGLKDFKFENGRCFCTLPVTLRVCNRYGTLHGGCMATLVDTVTSAALLTRSKRSGISIHLSVAYLSGAREGEEVEVEGRVDRVGRTTANLRAEIRRKKDGVLLATGDHVKFLPGTEVDAPQSKL